MDKLGEFIVGLQTILDSPNPPRDDLVRVIQATQRDFLTSALALSTMTWPTRTHLELVKIIISLQIPEPPRDVVLADPTTSHEADPFFAADYFDKLRNQLLSTPLSTLADSDGSWVRNIGFSIEATIMQASRRADVLEKLDEISKAEDARGGYGMGRMRTYCAHVLGSGTLATVHWESVARMVFTMFYLLPFTTKTMPAPTLPTSQGEQPLHPHMVKLVAHYGTWLQIVQQLVENHGPAMCRRMPTVIADPATAQFRWGIPTLHLVATTELLRNVLMRRLLLSRAQSGAVQTDAAAAAAAPWSSSTSAIGAEEQRLEQFELAVLGKIIAQDASAVYGIMTEQHRLLQMHEEFAKNHEHLPVVPGTAECLRFSLTRTCHGLAPILSYEEQALTQAMDMDKLLECMRDMKASTVNFCYGPLYGCYPPGTSSIPAYAEMLLLRMATTLFNLDQPWGDVATLLSPGRVAGITQELATRMLQVLHISSAYFDFFSLNTTEPEADPPVEFAELSNIMGRLMRRSFVHQPFSTALSQDIDGMLAELTFVKLVDLSIEWVHEFVGFGQTFMSPQLLYTQVAATIERAAASLVRVNSAAALVDSLARITHSQWAALAAIRFNGPGQDLASSSSNSSNERSALSIVFSIAHRLASMGQLPDSALGLLGADRWQATVAMCHPESVFLAYAVMAQCAAPARELVQVDDGGHFRVMLNQRGVGALKVLEKTIAKDGGVSGWTGIQLLLAPPIYAETGDNTAAQFTQSQLSSAVRVLSSGQLAELAYKLGVPESSLGFSGQDMRLVAHFIQHYAENASTLLPLLSEIVLAAPGASADAAARAQAKPNPFSTPNILSKVPLIEVPSSPTACNIDATIREWRRQVAQLPFAESRRCIQELVTSCYPSTVKHYLELVLVRFMEAEPVVGVELVIGSIANFMWTTQMVYSRQSSPFHEIRGMFSPVSPKPLPVAETITSSVDDKAKELARSRKEPVFNAVVGGKVRSGAAASSGGPASKAPITTAERGSGPGSRSGGRAHFQADSSAPRAIDTVRSPVACGRILLLLTALRYGRSMGNTPIYMWLTDCLDYAPVPVLQRYFDALLIERPPVFNVGLPVEPDWKSKAAAFASLWAKDHQLRARPMMQALGVSLMRFVLHNGGEQWSGRWAEWSTAINEAVGRQFISLQTSPNQSDIVRAMLLVPPKDSLMTADSHPLFRLASLLSVSPVHEGLAFADSKDWFATHVLPRIVESLADNAIARAILGQVLSSVDSLYRMVPWLDMATPSALSASLNHGRPVALSPDAAKEHFVSRLSPLARVLLAIANYVEGQAHDIGDNDPDVDMADADDARTSVKPSVSSPAASEASLSGSHDDGSNTEETFNWQWLDELLVVYLSGSSSDPANHSDAIDALLDVYTLSSAHSLRQSIEHVVVASCLHEPSTAQTILRRVFSMRPLDIFTLHSLRPRSLSQMAPVTDTADDMEAAFRPSYELYPLAKLVLQSVLGTGGEGKAAEVVLLVQSCFWAMAEQPDIRRQLIALNPRLIPKSERPAASIAGVSFSSIKSVTSGGLFIPAETAASAAAYALDRSMYLLTLLLLNSEDSDNVKQFTRALASSRMILATIMMYLGPSMLQFSALPISLKLLSLLWAAVDNGEAMVGEVKAAQLWSGTNFKRLAKRLSDDAPEVYITWPDIKEKYIAQ